MNNDPRTINYILNYRSGDSVWFWFATFLGSFSLHLLVFLVLLSSAQFQSLNPQSNQDIIAIDIIDVPSVKKPKLEVKPQPTVQPNVTANLDAKKSEIKTSLQTQTKVTKPVSKVNQKSVKTAYFPTQNPGNDLLNQTNKNSIKEKSLNNQSIKPKPEILPPIKPKININSAQKPIEKKTTPLEDVPWNNRQEVELGKGTPLPNNISPVSQIPKSESLPIPKSENLPISKPESPPISNPERASIRKPENYPVPKPENSQVPKSENYQIPKLERSQIPKPENLPIPKPESSLIPKLENSQVPKSENYQIPKPEKSPVPKGMGVRVNITPILKDEIQKLREEKKLNVGALPDVIAEYKGSLTKELEIDIKANDSQLKSANVLASLVIDKNGNFKQGVVINIEPDILKSEKNRYELLLSELFERENFVSAYNLDGTQPELSNLYLRIRIEVIHKSKR